MKPAVLAGLLLMVCAAPAMAQISDDVVRIGVLTDETGPYADSAGPGSVLAAQMAAADFGGTVHGKPIEIVHADTQNKPDVAATVARRWFDTDKVDAIVDLPVTPIALAVQQVAKEKNRTVMITASAVSEFTSKFCSPVSTHWADDTHALAAGTARAVMAQGGDSWFFITVDQTFGLALEREATDVIKAGNGTVLGEVRHPIGATDFSSLLLQAQSSGAKVIGLASVGNDLVNLIKQAGEFGIARSGTTTLAGFLIYIQDINALGLQTAQGLTFTASYYWDQNDEARAFARRFFAKMHMMPSKNQALIYTAVTQYPARGRRGRNGRRRRREPRDARPPVQLFRTPRDDTRRRPRAVRHDAVEGEGAVGEQGALGLLHPSPRHPRRRRVPAAQPRGLRRLTVHSPSPFGRGVG